MSDKDITRRKALSTTGGIGSALVGIPAAAAAQSGGDTDKQEAHREELTEEDVREALADIELKPSAGSAQGVDIAASEVPEDAEVYVGKYKNAETPTGKPFAIESYEEYLERDAPPGFEPARGQQVGTSDISDFFYLQEDIGSVTIEGYTLNVGIGAGVTIEGSFAGDLEATLSLDIYINNASFALTSFTVGYGTSGDGICLGPFDLNYSYVPGLEVSLCGSVGFNDVNGGDQLEVSFSPGIDLCVDPCPVITCSYCKGLSVSLSHRFDNPL